MEAHTTGMGLRFFSSLFIIFVNSYAQAVGGDACLKSAIKSLKSAYAFMGGADAAGNASVVSTTSATLETSGVAKSSTAASMSTTAAANASSCAKDAGLAIETAKSCVAQETDPNLKPAVAKQSKTIIKEAGDLIDDCQQKAAGHAGTAGAQNDMATTMMMMSAMQGLGSLGGGGSGGGDVGDFGFGSTGGGSDYNFGGGYGGGGLNAPPERQTPILISPNHERTPASSSIDPVGQLEDPLKNKNFGEEMTFKDSSPADFGTENKDNSRGLSSFSSAPSLGAASSESESLDSKGKNSLSSAGSKGDSHEQALANGKAQDSKGEDFASLDFDSFDFDKKSAEEEELEAAKDINFLGKNKKSKKTLAQELVEKKQAQKEARQKARDKAEAHARKLATDFVITPKSCAERNWMGSECQALKNDPLLK